MVVEGVGECVLLWVVVDVASTAVQTDQQNNNYVGQVSAGFSIPFIAVFWLVGLFLSAVRHPCIHIRRLLELVVVRCFERGKENRSFVFWVGCTLKN